ncbi:MAG: hypothetical protein Q9167_005970 [Letrouitia subvulpina]
MHKGQFIRCLVGLICTSSALQWDPKHVGYNLNENQDAAEPTDYWGEWANHTYHPSPTNWRFPFYVLTIDRYVDGDPTNNEANGTVFEHNWMTNQFRFGGDLKGLLNDLDYIQGLGMKGIYLTGSPFLNMPWSGDGYGPLDFTLLDRHHGAIQDWRELITEIHRRDMYVILDNTMATFVQPPPPNALEADEYGDIKGTGAYPSYQSQLSRFASVQDRLREWRNDVFDKIKVMSCIQIAMLDIDGFRMDKALQTTPDKMAEFSSWQRQCARDHGKNNFLMVGEIVGDPNLASIYVGRGKQPDQAEFNVSNALTATKDTNRSSFIRDFGMSALDGAALHYDIYGAMTRFLGLDGPWGAYGVDWVQQWSKLVSHNDMVNAETGIFDPRHMFGMTGQDVFRWPALANGTQRQLLGFLVTMLEMPGIPMILYGEEQAFYILENQANDYVFGRTPMASQRAWQLHGCYHLGETVYVDIPFNSSGYGCVDDSVSLDHRDPSHPVRNVLRRMFELRRQYPTLNDGYNLLTLSNRTYDIFLPGSQGLPSPHGIWSVYRGRAEGAQDFTGEGQGNQGVWFVYQNENKTVDYKFDCKSQEKSDALISAFPANTVVKNLFYPYEEISLEASTFKFGKVCPCELWTWTDPFAGIEGSDEVNGCLSTLTIAAWGFKAFVPKQHWQKPSPAITRVIPGHDARIESTVSYGESETVPIQIRFSSEMDCDSIANNLVISSTTAFNQTAELNRSSVTCFSTDTDAPRYTAEIATAFIFNADIINVANGVHTYSVKNASTGDALLHTGSVDRFMFRIGQSDNPMVFPTSSNYTKGLLHKHSKTGHLLISPRASGADKLRYSTNWGSSFSDWMDYTEENITVRPQQWVGTETQRWDGTHVIVHYWSAKTGSSDHVQHADLDRGDLPSRRWPHAFIEGSWNQWGYDGGLPNAMHQDSNGLWKFDLVAEWPTQLMVNIWGMNPDNVPDKSMAFGDVDGDHILDWVPPDSLAQNVINCSVVPSQRRLGYQLVVNDGNYYYYFEPFGESSVQTALSVLLALVPLATAIIGCLGFMKFFYKIKFNEMGMTEKEGLLSHVHPKIPGRDTLKKFTASFFPPSNTDTPQTTSELNSGALAVDSGSPNRRTVLIATMEYEIEDWEIKIKIGGLGVMASLMGKNLGHQNLIWVVPCVGGVSYPIDRVAQPMRVTVVGKTYKIEVQYHTLRNITFVLLDAPVFRKQTKAEPYPPRMDDLDSAVYYSAWNACIAEALRRFSVDLYHINDYHGAVAPLHLLPRTIPVCLSLHNAEFQGLWPLRTSEELEEICQVYDLESSVVRNYVQFGQVFNLLHAGASYLRKHQRGFGAVGVSEKYGKRSFARYPIFWGLSKVGALPNPDPTDLGDWDKKPPGQGGVVIDDTMEQERENLRVSAQKWAGLNVDPKAELFVFVGRWSQQKGIDLIADVFFSILEDNPKAQLICVGPVIDLYGKFAALKLSKMMKKYPKRVYSKPEFTALPPYIFSGAEFSLIPSRDEPFGLVAVEFGRKGALGVGSRVGGLGQMPGWWYTIESPTTKHLLNQFKGAIHTALGTKAETRAMMRARARLQRFPVAQWIEDLEKLQSKSIDLHERVARRQHGIFRFAADDDSNGSCTPPTSSIPSSVFNSAPSTAPSSQPQSRTASPSREAIVPGTNGQLSLGRFFGPSYSFGIPRGRSRSASRSRLSKRSLSNPRSERSRSGLRIGHVASPGGGESDDRASRKRSRSGSRTRNRSACSLRSMPGNIEARVNPRVSVVPEGNEDLATHFQSSLQAQPLEEVSFPPNSETFGSETFNEGFPPKHPQLDQIDVAGPSIPPTASPTEQGRLHKSESMLSLHSVMSDHKGFNLQKVNPFFTDSSETYYKAFDKGLDVVDRKNSEDQLCIEEYLVKSEKSWFNRFHSAKMGNTAAASRQTTPASSVFRMPWRESSPAPNPRLRNNSSRSDSSLSGSAVGDFLLGEDYVPPKGLKKFLQRKIGDWFLYSFLLAFGQIVAANSYQITLLTNENGQAANKLYVVASIYLAASVFWWISFRLVKQVYILSIPFFFYGLAFLLVGMGPFVSNYGGRGWVHNVATALYAAASASGSLFFALNFGTEGGTPAQTWAFRACVIQGSQQIYVAALWYWGSTITTSSTAQGSSSVQLTSRRAVAAITTPIAFLFWAVGLILFLGLPDYYRQWPGKIPSFYSALFRRKIVLWFFFVVVVQNYWLAAPYGRNWRYLWSSQYAPAWGIVLLILIFFVGVWALMLAVLGHLSKQHSWILPIFSVGLGAPRWSQMLWAVSGIGTYVPWGTRAIGALLGRALWLWLGVLDALQGVGFGMILLQTLTRFHVAFTLLFAQIIGSLATIAARASAPDATGPGDVFPNFAFSIKAGIEQHWFWIALVFQLIIPVGFFLFFRKAQLFKP